MKWTLFFVLCWSSGCEYREQVGRTGNAPLPSGVPDASPSTSRDCSEFQIPSSDCSLSKGACTFDSDCPNLNERCNTATKSCFRADDRCVGTPCSLDDDCPSTERCNRISNTCFDQGEDQTCMPCFLLSGDCGGEVCDTDSMMCM